MDDVGDRARRFALWYVGRYEASTTMVRRALVRWARRHELVLPDVQPILDELVQARWVDDARYAESSVERLRARGWPASRIKQWLASRGVERPAAPEEGEDLQSARRYARRRRLGVYRVPPGDADRLRKDLMSMVRAGFGWAVARAALEAASDGEEDEQEPASWS